MVKNNLINDHYRRNRDRLVKRTVYRVPHKSLAIAEEVVQEAYTRAIKYFSTYSRNKPFEVWFSHILRNVIKDVKLAEKDRGVSYEVDNIEELVVTKEEQKQYTYILSSIHSIENDRDKEVVSLFYIYEYRSKDISEYLGLSHVNVRQILLRFRNKMKDDIL